MPIWTYAIDHPDGLFLVDAGADEGYNDPITWAGHQGERCFIHSFIRIDVSAGQVLPARLQTVDRGPRKSRRSS